SAPSDELLSKFFEDHKKQIGSAANGEYRPGFRQPKKVKLQYIQVTYAAIDEQVTKSRPVTDQEIEDYYEAKKDIDTRLHEVETGPPAGGESTPIEPEIAPEDDDQPKGPSLEPQSKPDAP